MFFLATGFGKGGLAHTSLEKEGLAVILTLLGSPRKAEENTSSHKRELPLSFVGGKAGVEQVMLAESQRP